MAETRESWGKELSPLTETGGTHLQVGCETFFSTWVDQGKVSRELCFVLSGKVLMKHLEISGCTSCHEENPHILVFFCLSL